MNRTELDIPASAHLPERGSEKHMHATTSTVRSSGVSRRRDLVGRGLMALNVLLTLAAFVNGVASTVVADPDDLVVQAWQMFGFVVFAGMWSLVALWPRRIPGIWELLIAHKLAITTFCLLNFSEPDAAVTATIDGYIMVTTVFAYVLCHGWLSWTGFSIRRAAARPADDRARRLVT